MQKRHPVFVKQALIPASSRLSTTDSFSAPTQLLRIDATPVVHHLVRGLCAAGVERIVVAIDTKASVAALQRTISADPCLAELKVEYVECKASLTKGQATSVMAAAKLFDETEPLLLVANHIFDARLLRKLVREGLDDQTDVVTLVDDSEELVRWAWMDHCDEFCKNGHCNVLVKVLKGDHGLAARVGKKLAMYDALEAGAHVINRAFFKLLGEKLAWSPLTTLADVLQELAMQGRVRYVSTGGLPWFGDLVIATLGTVRIQASAIKPEWIEQAQQMLSEVHRMPCAATPPQLPMSSPGSFPSLIELGDTIGEGAVGKVVAGVATVKMDKKNLAVKMIRKGRSEVDGTPELGDREQIIMWEVHVLQELGAHEHIVRVMDVVDLVDATYIVMQRVDGPELMDYMEMQPEGRLELRVVQRVLGQMLCALSHAHGKGFLHCDIKPQNIRLDSSCQHAVLTDWGFAQRIGTLASICQGTPAYAPPEQLTGYCSESVTGRRPLCPAVDMWSLGITVYQMLCGRLPFEGNCFEDLVTNVLRLNYYFPDFLSVHAQHVVESMLQISPIDRATPKELFASPWLAEVAPVGACEECVECDEDQVPWWRRQQVRRVLIGSAYMAVCVLLLCAKAALGTDELLLMAEDEHESHPA